MSINTSILFACCITLLTACYYDKEELLYADDTCDSVGVSFSADIMPIINNSCATVGCHVQGGSGTGLLENYNQVLAKVNDGSFERRVTVQLDMPPSSPLSDCQLAHISQWISDGAPNN